MHKKPVYLKYFCEEEIPNLKAFAELGLPLRQIVKVRSKADQVGSVQNQTFLPLTNMAEHEVLTRNLKEELATIAEQGTHGCICEIDVS